MRYLDMCDEFNDILASVGIDVSSLSNNIITPDIDMGKTTSPSPIKDKDEIINEEKAEEPSEAETPNEILSSNVTLSEDDFSEILDSNGFVESQEEYNEEETEEEETNEEELDELLDNMEEYNPDEEDVSDENIGEANVNLQAVAAIDDFAEAIARARARAESSSSDAPSEAPDTSTTEEVSINNNSAIPENSPTLQVESYTSRFSGIEWYDKVREQRVIIAGQGGIGSWLSLQIARIVPATMVLYDDDVVEAVNMAGQLYRKDDVGKAKVDAIADAIVNYTSTANVYAVKEKFTLESEPGNIMISGFDNMEARKVFFFMWKNHVKSKLEEERSNCLYMDGRLTIDKFQILCIRGDDEYNKERYEREFLFNESEVEHAACSMKQTTYLACMIGSVMTNLFVNFTYNMLDPVICYDLPFFTEYDAQNMIFKTEA